MFDYRLFDHRTTQFRPRKRRLASRRRFDYPMGMSFVEIIEELPRLSLDERRQLVRKLMDLEPDREAIETCDYLAAEAMQMLDKIEEEDGHRSAQG